MKRLICVLVLLYSLLASAQPNQPASELDTLRTVYQKNLAFLGAEYSNKVALLNQRYVTALDDLMKRMTQAGNLDGALAVKADKMALLNQSSSTQEMPNPQKAVSIGRGREDSAARQTVLQAPPAARAARSDSMPRVGGMDPLVGKWNWCGVGFLHIRSNGTFYWEYDPPWQGTWAKDPDGGERDYLMFWGDGPEHITISKSGNRLSGGKPHQYGILVDRPASD